MSAGKSYLKLLIKDVEGTCQNSYVHRTVSKFWNDKDTTVLRTDLKTAAELQSRQMFIWPCNVIHFYSKTN